MQHDEFCLNGLRYVIAYPKGFAASKLHPVILCLHGAGGRGNDMVPVLNNPFFRDFLQY